MARGRYTESYSGFVALGTLVPQGLALAGLARRDEAAGDVTAAHQAVRRAADPQPPDRGAGLTSTALEGLCRLAAGRGDRALASTLLAEATQLRTTSSRPAPPHEQRDLATTFVELAPDLLPNF